MSKKILTNFNVLSKITRSKKQHNDITYINLVFSFAILDSLQPETVAAQMLNMAFSCASAVVYGIAVPLCKAVITCETTNFGQGVSAWMRMKVGQ